MFKHILIATDGSEIATKAVDHGLGLARDLKAQVTVVTVSEIVSAFALAREAQEGDPAPMHQFEAAAEAAAQRVLDAAARKANAAGVPCVTVHVTDRHPADGIVETARDKGCDLIVMASHGRRGIDRLLLGSQAVEVLTHGKLPTLIVR